mmetsp:Transcript_7307/g.17077  ORF Transcript_7307/g.17077 Transcript_7307/m.17077 type:complete len:241 (-) Transcript_7307:362-1084(-)
MNECMNEWMNDEVLLRVAVCPSERAPLLGGEVALQNEGSIAASLLRRWTRVSDEQKRGHATAAAKGEFVTWAKHLEELQQKVLGSIAVGLALLLDEQERLLHCLLVARLADQSLRKRETLIRSQAVAAGDQALDLARVHVALVLGQLDGGQHGNDGRVTRQVLEVGAERVSQGSGRVQVASRQSTASEAGVRVAPDLGDPGKLVLLLDLRRGLEVRQLLEERHHLVGRHRAVLEGGEGLL